MHLPVHAVHAWLHDCIYISCICACVRVLPHAYASCVGTDMHELVPMGLGHSCMSCTTRFSPKCLIHIDPQVPLAASYVLGAMMYV